VRPRGVTGVVDEVFDALVVLDMDDGVIARAAALEPTSLRTLDAIHLATALGIDTADLAFVTFDERLAQAAARQRLRVMPTGA
jgi:predicted nucleic acid-binding protein